MTEGAICFGQSVYTHYAKCAEYNARREIREAAERRAQLQALRIRNAGLPADRDGLGGVVGYVRRFGVDATTAAGVGLCQDFAAKWVAGTPPRDGFALVGHQGGGKSTLALCLARDLLAAGVDVRWEPVPALYNRLLAASREGDLEDELRRLGRFQVLILDDLGREKPSAWWVDQVLFPLVDGRYAAGKPLVATTNYGWPQLEALYGNAGSQRGEHAHSATQLLDRLQHRTAAMAFGPQHSHRQAKWEFAEGAAA